MELQVARNALLDSTVRIQQNLLYLAQCISIQLQVQQNVQLALQDSSVDLMELLHNASLVKYAEAMK